MNPYQEKIKKFCEERNWSQFHNPKDLLLGIVEEIGELRNIVKWEQNPETIKEVMLKNKEEVEDAVGDIFWFLSLLANGCNIDIDNAAQLVIEDNNKRFPIEKTKDKHTNTHLGGHDGKY